MPSIFEPREPKDPGLTLGEIGIASGGALLVYLSLGDRLADGRKKFDPDHPDEDVLLRDMEGVWDIGRHLDEWAAAPDQGPQLLLAISGPKVVDRHIVAAVPIDVSRWLDPSLQSATPNRWNVPLLDETRMDERSLRGRKVNEVRFGQFSWQLHIWVDAEGIQRHPTP